MANFQDILDRQKSEIDNVRDEQARLWIKISNEHQNNVPDKVLHEYQKACRKESMALEDRHVKERENIPFYGEVLKQEREIITRIRDLHQDIEFRTRIEEKSLENQAKLDAIQEEMLRLMGQSNSPGNHLQRTRS